MEVTYSSLKGKAFVVTGAASGMGRAIALRLAEQGSNVGLLDVKKPTEVQETISKMEGGASSVALAVDVTKASEVDAAIKAVHDKFGRLDGAANMAGIVGNRKMGDTGYAVESITDEDWDAVMKVNLDGVKNSMRAELQLMSDSGSIVNAASMSGQQPNPWRAHYGTSKWAVIGLTKAAAGEVGGKGIRVNAVAPGIVKTPLTETLGQEAMANLFSSRISLGRLAEPDEVAKVVVFLLSDVPGYVTGSVVNVDGGWL